MHILFVTYDYLPAGSAEANLLNKLIKSIIKNNCIVDVITIKNNLLQKDFEKVNGIKIFRVISSHSISIKGSVGSCSRGELIKLAIEKAINIIFKNRKKNFLNNSVINSLYNGFKKYNLNNYDIIVPVCGYYETYEATKKYCNKNNLKSHIFVYQIDPLAENSSYKLETYKSRLLFESSILNTASAIITTDIVKKEKIALNMDSDNVFPLEFPSITNMTNNNQCSEISSEIKCVFSGYIYNNIRNPEYTFKLFSKLNSQNIKLYIVGSGSEEQVNAYKNAFPNRFIQVGSVPLEKSLEYIKSADMLVNIGNNITNAVPSKIFDYISTGKPIINIYKNKDCPTLKYFKKYNNSISIFEDMDKIDFNTKAVESFINERLGKITTYEEIEKNFHECTADYVAGEIYRILSKVKEENNVSGEKL